MVNTLPKSVSGALAEIRAQNTWNSESLKELCDAADMSQEWNEADGETFEAVVFAAAKKLGVEIM